MARPTKRGLDYFALDVKMSDEVEIIEAQYGLEGFAILIKLFQKIYGEGYYLKWDEREQILFSSRVSSDRNLVTSIVSDCVKWGIFSEEMYKRYGILTSRRIQEQYFTAVYKRTNVEAIKEYLLVDVSNRTNLKMMSINNEEVEIIDDENKATTIVSDDGNEDTTIDTDDKSTQSKEKKNKDIYSAFFEECWKMYPSKKGKGRISDSKKKEIYKLGDEFKRCIERYIAYVEEQRRNGFRDLKYQNGSTFFNSGYVDYLDANYEAETVGNFQGDQSKRTSSTQGWDIPLQPRRIQPRRRE